MFLKLTSRTFQNFYIVEFEDAACVENAILSHCQHPKQNSGNPSIPVYSPFLWFAGNGAKDPASAPESPNEFRECSVPVFLPPKSISSDEEMAQHLSQFSTVRFLRVALNFELNFLKKIIIKPRSVVPGSAGLLVEH